MEEEFGEENKKIFVFKNGRNLPTLYGFSGWVSRSSTKYCLMYGIVPTVYFCIFHVDLYFFVHKFRTKASHHRAFDKVRITLPGTSKFPWDYF
jgi:hypothetical protein